MNIAVCASPVVTDYTLVQEDAFISEMLSFAAAHPQHRFIFIFHSPPPAERVFPDNAIPVLLSLTKHTPPRIALWYRLKVMPLLKKEKIHFCLSAFLCVKTKIPQCLFYPDITFLYQPGSKKMKQLSYLKKKLPRCLEKAAAIVVSAAFVKDELTARFGVASSKIDIYYPAPSPDIHPAGYNEREKIKEQYADGHEYFLYKGLISPQKNLVNLLKAFSAFKKRQKSGMKLLIAGKEGTDFPEFKEQLRLYRFSNDVKIFPGADTGSPDPLMAAAYAFVYVPAFELGPASVPEAMIYQVPVIASDTGVLRETGGDAVLYAQPAEAKDIAEKMMLVFKDEKVRREYIEKGKVQAAAFLQSRPLSVIDIIESIIQKLPQKQTNLSN